MHHGDPDLIWIPDAATQYERSRTTLDRLIDDGTIHEVKFIGDRRVFLRKSELDRVLGRPSTDVPGHDNANAG